MCSCGVADRQRERRSGSLSSPPRLDIHCILYSIQKQPQLKKDSSRLSIKESNVAKSPVVIPGMLPDVVGRFSPIQGRL